MSRPEGGLILIMLFRILKNVIACLIIRLRSRVCQLKGHCIEFKYYADGIHSGLTPPG